MPKTDTVGVLSQASSIMMGRVREEAVNCAEEKVNSHVAYFHLKRGLFAHDIEFNKGGTSKEPGKHMRDGIVSCETDYGVDTDIQYALSEIRTDLDSFSNAEARSLEADAYLMSEKELQALPASYHLERPLQAEWAFGKWVALMTTGDHRLLTHLRVGKNLFLKPYRLMKSAGMARSIGLVLWSIPLLVILAAYVYAIATGIGCLLHNERLMSTSIGTVIPHAAMALAWLAGFFILEKFSKGTAKWIRAIRSLFKLPVWLVMFLIRNVLMPFLLFLPIYTYIKTVDPYFVRTMGELED
jgi:NTE family protein